MTNFTYKTTADNWLNTPLTIKGTGTPTNCTFSIKGDSTQYAIIQDTVYIDDKIGTLSPIGFIECSNGVYTYTDISNGLSRDSEYPCIAVAHVLSML